MTPSSPWPRLMGQKIWNVDAFAWDGCVRVMKGGRCVVIQVKLKRGETVEKALKRLKKIIDKEGMMRQLRANRYFEKPSEKRRRKSARARARMMAG